jgi:hypothetical protein
VRRFPVDCLFSRTHTGPLSAASSFEHCFRSLDELRAEGIQSRGGPYRQGRGGHRGFQRQRCSDRQGAGGRGGDRRRQLRRQVRRPRRGSSTTSKSNGGRGIAIQGDVSKSADVSRLFAEAKAAFAAGRADYGRIRQRKAPALLARGKRLSRQSSISPFRDVRVSIASVPKNCRERRHDIAPRHSGDGRIHCQHAY